jgi:predicted helicase
MLKAYIKKIWQKYSQGDAREESYYSILEDLLNEYAKFSKRNNVSITQLPKKTEAGSPDFRIWDGSQQITGYIEAKAPTVKDLDEIAASEQLQRYLKNFPNLILTNFLEFKLYRNGELKDSVLIGRQDTLLRIGIKPPAEHEQAFKNLLDKFFSFSLPKDYTAETLAHVLADKTRFLREEVVKEEVKKEKSSLTGFYDAFKKYLISDLSMGGFVDLFSQTIVYGLFAARMRAGENFDRKHAYDNIPKTIGILSELFKFISLGEVPEQMKWGIDDIANVLSVVDVKRIFSEYYHSGKGKDPVVYFYETFLSIYNPNLRERRGVYYTPEPVVKYIVNSLNEILKDKINIVGGLSDRRVTVLDPAAGTLSFITEAVQCAIKEFTEKYGEGNKQKFIKEHILNDFYAFELMMAPYAIGHIKFSFILEEEGYTLTDVERPNFYLTNTLEMKTLEKTNLPLMSALSEESHLAEAVKKDTPILVIMGNPPYSVSSMNKSDFIEEAMKVYKEDVKNERNIQPLSNDYIKFIRFAHWKIDQSKKGVIGMITDNSYLSGIIHRGMRKKLLKSFDEIYILNLHGNSRIGEKTPEGNKDENVFDIMQGVSISLFIKSGEHKGLGKVYYQDVFGLREDKYNFLGTHSFRTTDWKELNPIEPYYFFVEKDFSMQEEYDKFWKITEIFKIPSSDVATHRDHFLIGFTSGVNTHRDDFVIGFTKEEVEQKMLTFTSDLPDEIVREGLNLKDTTDWKVEVAREKVKKIDWRKHIRQYAYRPFDIRYICYLSYLIDRDRIELMKNFFEENLGIILRRTAENTVNWRQVFICKDILDANYLSARTYVFSLYHYPSSGKNHLFEESAEQNNKLPNLNPELIQKLNETYKTDVTPEQVFNYIYSVLYSNIYREKYAEFLKIDFPKVPFTSDYNLFKKMGELGKKLVDLHLLSSSELYNPISKFRGQGSGMVEKVKYYGEEKRVYINNDNYFDSVEKEVFEYQIGGYQVCDKWLKDRKERILSLIEAEQYCKIVTAISKTLEIQQAIDSLYRDVELEVIKNA